MGELPVVHIDRPLTDDDLSFAAAFDSGRAAAAGLAVTEPEPLPVGHPLLGRDE